MKRVLTLTLNPTVDINTSVGQVVPERKLRCEPPTREPGGGGINVSRAIQRLGGTSTALYLGGGTTGDMLEQLLANEGVLQLRVGLREWTRENLIVFEHGSGQQFRFGMPGPKVSREEWERCLDAAAATQPTPDYIVASGSLPPGVPDEVFALLSHRAEELGARLIVDTSGEPLRRAMKAGAYLFKPNINEFRDLTGANLVDEPAQVEAARQVISEGCCSVIVLSLGAGGALMITAEEFSHVRTPTVPIRSKVGAGDSMVAGIVLGLARDMPIADAVRFGVAAGAAAVMTDGTELCRRSDAERLYEQLKAEA